MTPPDMYAALMAERYGLSAPITAAEITRLGGGARDQADDTDQVIRAADYGWSVDQIAALTRLPAARVERILTHHRRTESEH